MNHNNNQPSSITSSLNQLKLGNLPQLKLSKSVKQVFYRHR